MRRFMAYFNALLLGMILGMIFLAVVHDWSASCRHLAAHAGRAPFVADLVSVVGITHRTTGALRDWQQRPRSGR
jgi:hypothetical protein